MILASHLFQESSDEEEDEEIARNGANFRFFQASSQAKVPVFELISDEEELDISRSQPSKFIAHQGAANNDEIEGNEKSDPKCVHSEQCVHSEESKHSEQSDGEEFFTQVPAVLAKPQSPVCTFHLSGCHCYIRTVEQ